jgi:hypothetical protein
MVLRTGASAASSHFFPNTAAHHLRGPSFAVICLLAVICFGLHLYECTN